MRLQTIGVKDLMQIDIELSKFQNLVLLYDDDAAMSDSKELF